MDDKYADLRAALPDLVEEARRKGGTNPRAQMIIDLLADYDRMRDALDGAATSLNTIATLAGSKDDYMGDMYQVRGYAHSRARVARAALAQEQGGSDA